MGSMRSNDVVAISAANSAHNVNSVANDRKYVSQFQSEKCESEKAESEK